MNRTEVADSDTSSALDTLGRINFVGFFSRNASDRRSGTVTGAHRALLTLFGIDLVFEKIFTNASVALLVDDVTDIDISEFVKSG
jgi:hypothetical protein